MAERLEESHELNDRFTNADSTLLASLEHQQPIHNVIPNYPPRAPDRSTAYLDGLRGLAALSVCIQHYIGFFDGNVHEHGFGENGNYYLASLPFLRIVFSGGSAAVAIFFILSGYVLSKSPLGLLRNGKRRACGMSLASAFIRRPIRLYGPPLGVALAIAILMHAPFGISSELTWAPPEATVFAELKTWLFDSIKFFSPFRTHGSNQGWFRYSIVIWTIPIELKGSILVYTLISIYLFTRSPQSLSLLFLSIASIVLLHLGKWTMACFIAGLVLAFIDTHSLDTTYLTRYCTPQAQSLLSHMSFVVGYYLLCQPAHASKPEYSLDTPGWHTLSLLTPRVYNKEQYFRYWHSWGALLVLYCALRIQWLQRFLNTRPLRYLGKVSFMLYLLHLPILGILGNRIARMFGQVSQNAETSWWNNRLHIPDVGPAGMSSRFLASLTVVLPIILGISDLGTTMLDTPSVRLGKRIAQRLGLRDAASRGKDVDTGEGGLPAHSMSTLTPGQGLQTSERL